MSGEMVLNSDRMQVAFRNERGIVTQRRRYKRGDVITAEDLPDGDERFKQLVEAGTLVPEDELAEEAEDQDGAPEGPEAPEEPQDKYTDMEYADLQAAAKDAGIAANQSADELRAALREA